MDVAIVGMGERDIPEDFELWGMPWDDEWTRFDVLFDIHHESLSTDKEIERAKDSWVPLYMQEPIYPHAIKYPIDDVIEVTGDYFSCSICYMIGLAILKELPSVDIFGVSGEEDYSHQKPAIEHMIGVARGRGMKVTVHGGSLLKQDVRYGYI